MIKKTTKTIHKAALIFLFGLGLVLSRPLYAAQNKENGLLRDTLHNISYKRSLYQPPAYQESHTYISVGALVIIKGIQTYPMFNGKVGQVAAYVTTTERWTVKLLTPIKISLGVKAHIGVKEYNLELMQAPEKAGTSPAQRSVALLKDRRCSLSSAYIETNALPIVCDRDLPQAQILQETYGATCKGTWVCQDCGGGNEQADECCIWCKRRPVWPPIRR